MPEMDVSRGFSEETGGFGSGSGSSEETGGFGSGSGFDGGIDSSFDRGSGTAGSSVPGRSRGRAADKSAADGRELWRRSRDDLLDVLTSLGFREELGHAIARHLGSPRAIDRMTAYLINVKPKSDELVVDEMLAIRSEIDAWRQKKEAREANAAYNAILYYGLEDE